MPIGEPAITSAVASSKTLNYNYNNENYYLKDDMSVYDDVNNNRLNLRRSSSSNSNSMIHSNAYEERNIYVSNNVLSDNVNNGNDSAKSEQKSYIHIEVYKGNLDNGGGDGGSSNTVTAKPKEMKSMIDSSAAVVAGANAYAFNGKSEQMGIISGDAMHHNNASPDSITELSSSTTTKT